MEIKENTSLNQLVQEYNQKQENIEKLRKDFESYLNKEEIYKIIKTAMKNNFILKNYFEDFFIILKPKQFSQFSGGTDAYSITIRYKGTTQESSKQFIGFIKEKGIKPEFEFIISELDKKNITLEKSLEIIKKAIEG